MGKKKRRRKIFLIVLLSCFVAVLAVFGAVVVKICYSSSMVPDFDMADFFTPPEAFARLLCTGSTENSKRILFVGNSLSYMHVAPLAVAKFAEAKLGDRPTVYQIMVPSCTLEKHLQNGFYQKLLQEQKLDVVVLQEQSTRSIEEFDPMYKAATTMTELARGAGAQVIWFEDWIDSTESEVMENRLVSNADKVVSGLNLKLAPVGEAFYADREKRTGARLFAGDNHHPAQAGTYLAACVLFETIYGQSCQGVPATVELKQEKREITTIELTKEEAERLQNLAAEVLRLRTHAASR